MWRLVCDWGLTFAFHAPAAVALKWMPWLTCLHLQTCPRSNRQTSGPERCHCKDICVCWRPSYQGTCRVDTARWQATRRSDANSMAARKTLNLGRHNSANPRGLLCERGGSLSWCSSCTSGLSEVSQMRSLGADRSPVSTHRGRNPRPSERIVSRVLFQAGSHRSQETIGSPAFFFSTFQSLLSASTPACCTTAFPASTKSDHSSFCFNLFLT